MADHPTSRISAFLAEEYRAANLAVSAGCIDHAWLHLKRAHILAQLKLVSHCQSHWRMLRLAVRLRDWREAAGQIIRFGLAPPGNLTGRLPIGNTGRANERLCADGDSA
ncbi:DUF3703 domain-containing protein [Erythrobacter sp. QSSC1-22B]|uniref:DUF3703 domain-containing protein n=1 Tax=Erythrobacter sp. QSSC1-22B TaxID=1860125 RepID=UPI001F2926BB|nr:DUF3703 domain-containing protein [Erythrobacter sp. QSSC1-22B]